MRDDKEIDAIATSPRAELLAAGSGLWKATWLTADWHRGDCMMRSGARLTIFDDGTAHFTACVRSEAGNDTWHQGFGISDLHGTFMFRFGYYDKRLDPQSRDLYYDTWDRYDKDRYPFAAIDINRVQWIASC